MRYSTKLDDLTPVSAEEAARLIKSAPNKHCRLDPIPTWILKKSPERFAPLFAALCNSTFLFGLPPSQKQAMVSARLKKPTMDPADLNSYRPISNLSFVSKFVERSVAARFVKHCDQNKLFPVRQSAFRRHHSTETAVLIVHNDIVRAVDKGQSTAMMFLDLSSAFDTVDHVHMLSILRRRFSVESPAIDWFQCYLSNRTQTFTVGDSKSDPRLVYCSVPQGSVLGPVKFIAYTEDAVKLFDHHKVNHHMYADDKQMYLHAESGSEAAVLERLAACFSDLSGWCASRRLQLNASKTELIWFGSRSMIRRIADEYRSISLCSTVLKSVVVVRNLGVLFDSELTMKQHINHVVSVGYYHLRRLRQIRRHVTRDAMKQLVSALVLSRIDYCNSVLIGLPACSIYPLQRLQNAAARLVMGLRARDHVTSTLAELHWLPVRFRILFKVSLIMFLIHSHQCPEYLSNIVTPLNSEPSRRRLRSSIGTDYLIPRTKTKFGERSFSVAGPTTWNALPESVRAAEEVATFKRLLKTHYFKSAFIL
jgi:hypothetical protein